MLGRNICWTSRGVPFGQDNDRSGPMVEGSHILWEEVQTRMHLLINIMTKKRVTIIFQNMIVKVHLLVLINFLKHAFQQKQWEVISWITFVIRYVINPYQVLFLPLKNHLPRAGCGQNRNGLSHLETSTPNRCDAIFRHLHKHQSLTYQNEFES